MQEGKEGSDVFLGGFTGVLGGLTGLEAGGGSFGFLCWPPGWDFSMIVEVFISVDDLYFLILSFFPRRFSPLHIICHLRIEIHTKRSDL